MTERRKSDGGRDAEGKAWKKSLNHKTEEKK